MKLVAITGSIGCGKSTLANLIKELGYVVYDVDMWTRNLYKKDKFNALILKNFPQVNENGKVNKKLLRNIVFSDKTQLEKLENIIHPILKQKLRQVIKNNADKNEIFFIDAALIFELGWNRYCNCIIVADVDKNIQKQRVMKRDGISEYEYNNIINLQMSNYDKACRADVVINTNKSLGILKVELFKVIGNI